MMVFFYELKETYIGFRGNEMPGAQVKSSMLMENEISMSQKYAKTFVVVFFCMLVTAWGGHASAEIIFEENFDGQAD